MRTITLPLLLLTLSALAGCQTGLPNVQYRTACSPVTDSTCDDKLISLGKFTLPKSLIVLAAKDDKAEVGHQVPTGAVAPGEWDGVMIEMLKDDPWGRETTLSITRRESTNLIQGINASVADNRQALIEKWGALAVKLAAAAVAPIAPCEPAKEKCPVFFPFPVVIDTAPLLGQMDSGEDSVFGEVTSKTDPNTRAGFTFTAGPVPSDAVPVSTYLEWAKGKRRHELVTSVCRTVQVRFDEAAPAPLGKTVWAFKVADPHYVQAISFPASGSMTAQPVCGFNVSSTSTVMDKTPDILGATLTQILAIAEAWKTKPEEKNAAGTGK